MKNSKIKDEKKPYWLKVIRHYENMLYCRNGLTIPFLIGSRIIIEPKKKLLSIRKFITDIDSITTPITIMKCNNINEYIIGIIDRETNCFRQQNPNLYREFGNLIITDDSFINITDSNEIISHLENLYNDKINKGIYSKDKGKWGDFTKIDKMQLQEIINS